MLHKIGFFFFSFDVIVQSLISGGIENVKNFMKSLICKTRFKSQNDKTKLTDLGVESQLSILEQLDFFNLLRVAEVNQHFSILSADVFKRKFSNKMVMMLSPSSDYYFDDIDYDDSIENSSQEIISKVLHVIGFGTKPTKIPELVFGDLIRIDDFDLSLKTMKHFGGVMQRLSIYFNYLKSGDSKKISEFINKYCSKSLVHIHIEHCTRNSLEHMTQPFEKVENVNFGLEVEHLENVELSLNQLFPQLRRLSFESILRMSDTYIDGHLPNLEHLNITIAVRQNFEGARVIENNFAKFIGKNTQIRSIAMRNISPNFLKLTTTLLPNLQNITLYGHLFENDNIHFNENLRKFVVKNGNFAPKNVTFSNLQELSINCYAADCESWIEFLDKHKNLRQFHIEESQINDVLFTKLTLNLENLEEMSVSLLKGRFISANTIYRFMQDHERLLKFSLKACKPEDEQFLRQELENDWNINKCHRGLSFERKMTMHSVS